MLYAEGEFYNEKEIDFSVNCSGNSCGNVGRMRKFG
jgi:hypothetical protein